MLKKINIIAFIILGIILSSFPVLVLAQSKSIQFKPQIELPNIKMSGDVVSFNEKGQGESDLLARYIKGVYNYSLEIGGILAAIILMAGGVLWLTSGGDSGKVSKAKELIFSSITGLVILFSSFMILKTINPNLVEIKGVKMITPKSISISGVCNSTKGPTPYSYEEEGVYYNEKGEVVSGKFCEDSEYCHQEKIDGKYTYNCVNKKLLSCCEYITPTNNWNQVNLSNNNYCYTVKGVACPSISRLEFKKIYKETSCIKEGGIEKNSSCIPSNTGK